MKIKITDDIIKEIKLAYYSGTPVSEISRQWGLTRGGIYYHLRDAPKRSHHRLTNTQVIEIITSDETLRALSKRYGVSYETIRRIKKSKKI
jgi:hypothetical protein